MKKERDHSSTFDNPESRWFGFKHVTPDEKTAKVAEVFSHVASSYDLMNDFMSLGVHRLWKAKLVTMMDIAARPFGQPHLLDVAGGTGDIAIRFLKTAPSGALATVCDINPAMIEVGRGKALDNGITEGIEWITGNAEELPIKNRAVDIYCISFGLRNVTHIDKALSEAARVLRPGGRFFCMEFSHLTSPTLAKLYDAYSFGVLPKLGEVIANNREAYQYLAESIRKFPTQEDLAKRIEAAGLGRVRFHNLSGGIACIHTAWKL